MNDFQRWFLTAALLLIAASSAYYCVTYRVIHPNDPEWSLLKNLTNMPAPFRGMSEASFDQQGGGFVPIINFGRSRPRRNTAMHSSSQPQTADELLDELDREYDRDYFSGIFARHGLSRNEAMLGGIVAPALLVIFAAYLTLGARLSRDALSWFLHRLKKITGSPAS